MGDEKKNTKDRKRDSGDVFNLVNRFQGNQKSQATDEVAKASNETGGGKISDRLKMFGGGLAKSPPPNETRGRSESPSDSSSREASPGRRTRRSSSARSVTAFETIAEESVSSGGEEGDSPTPLPSIPPSNSRRQSQEKLKLDGLTTEEVSSAKSDVGGNKTPSPPLPGQRRHSGGVVSPLVVSSSPSSKRASVPPHHGSEDLAMYLSSANLPHLEHLKERSDRERTINVDRRVRLLLAPPKMAKDKVPFEFKFVDFADKGKLHVWKQKVSVRTYTYVHV